MAKWIKLGTQILTHERFLAAGPLGRDLYTWGMAHSGFHERDGFLPTIAVETSSWGAGTADGNTALADRLVEVGLWGRTDGGFMVLRWVEQGNATKAELEESRAGWAENKRVQRNHPKPRRGGKKKNDSKPLPQPQMSSVDISDVHEGVPYSLSKTSDEVRERSSSVPRAVDVGPEAPPPANDSSTSTVVHRGDEVPDDAREVFAGLTMMRALRTPLADVWAMFCNKNSGQHFKSRELLLGAWDSWIRRQFAYDDQKSASRPAAQRGGASAQARKPLPWPVAGGDR